MRASFFLVAWVALVAAAPATAQDAHVLFLVSRIDPSACTSGGTAELDAEIFTTNAAVGRELVHLALSCAEAANLREGSTATATLTGPALSQVRLAPPSAFPTPDVSALLGQSLTALDASFTSIGPPPFGWDRWYAEGFGVRAPAGVVTMVVLPVPPDLACSEVPARGGLDHAGPPLRRTDRCEWPGESDRHRLDPGLAGFVSGGYFVVTRED